MKSRRKGKLEMQSHAQTCLTEERVGGDTRLKGKERETSRVLTLAMISFCALELVQTVMGYHT